MLKRTLSKLTTLPGILIAWLTVTLLGGAVVWLIFGLIGSPLDVLSFIRSGGGPGRVKVMGTSVAESLSWSPDGKYLAAGYLMGSSVDIWDVQSGRAVHSLNNFRGGVDIVSWSPDGKYLATASSELSNTFRVWDTATWREVFANDPVPRTAITLTSVTSIAWAPDSKRVAVGLNTTLMPGAGGSAQKEQEEMQGVPGLLRVFDVP